MLTRISFLLLFVLFAMNFEAVSQTSFPVENGVSQTLARWRAAHYSNVKYKLDITLEKGAPLMKGTLEVTVTLTGEGAQNDLVLDWRTTSFANDKDKPYAWVTEVNGKKDVPVVTINEHLKIPRPFLKVGENVIKIDFASPIKISGAAITRYVDKEDGGEYIYSLFVPSDASTAFPCFDQPDLKARFTLTVIAPLDWKVITNEFSRSRIDILSSEKAKSEAKVEKLPNGNIQETIKIDSGMTVFDTTNPISTYVFAFAAGPFAQFNESELPALAGIARLKNTLHADAGSDIYVRRSQAEKFKPHAAEVFRLNREGVKFLEEYFDYKFPFPKYDLVLIPEFPFGGMEHAGATFLRETSIIFPQEPTANDHISRANLIFHEAAHQWFGDTVTMRWFDDLWLKEGFAEFMAYKTLEKTMPQYNAWKVFYERNKQAAYLTDSTRGTTPIYQEIPNLSAAKSAYGNIVYRKAPSFLKQAEFYLGADNFQKAVRSFLKKHQFANAGWQDLISDFQEAKLTERRKSKFYLELASEDDKKAFDAHERSEIKEWADKWVTKRSMSVIRVRPELLQNSMKLDWAAGWSHIGSGMIIPEYFDQEDISGEKTNWLQKAKVLRVFGDGHREVAKTDFGVRFYDQTPFAKSLTQVRREAIPSEAKAEVAEDKPRKNLFKVDATDPLYVFPNYEDYGYGVFLMDDNSKKYVLENIQNEKDVFLRAMMWGSLWDSVREQELDPKEYVELVIRNLGVTTPSAQSASTPPSKAGELKSSESDETTIAVLLGRVSTAMNYYLPEKDREALAPQIENLLIDKILEIRETGQRLTYYRAFLNIASTDTGRRVLKDILRGQFWGRGAVYDAAKQKIDDRADTPAEKLPDTHVKPQQISLKTKDKFDIVTRLLILGDKDAPALLAGLEKTETSDEAKRYAYAAKAGIATADNKAKFWNDFVNNKEISESWIEAAFVTFNSARHSDLTAPYLEKALAELPNLKRNRKIFFVNGWLGSFIGGQRDERSLQTVNKFLADNPNLDRDLRLKILENVDTIERAVKIRAKYNK